MAGGRPTKMIIDIAEGKDSTSFVISDGKDTRVVDCNDDCVPLLVAMIEKLGVGIKYIKLKEVGEPLIDWLKRKCQEQGITEGVVNG